MSAGDDLSDIPIERQIALGLERVQAHVNRLSEIKRNVSTAVHTSSAPPPAAAADGGAYPPPNLDSPPEGANPSSRWLWYAWNSAILDAGDTWPKTNAMGTVGWRRLHSTRRALQSGLRWTSHRGRRLRSSRCRGDVWRRVGWLRSRRQ